MDDQELTPEEEAAFRNLEREADPPRLIEERLVRTLRAEGVLQGKGQGRPRGPWLQLAAVAASLVVFGGGTVLGQWMGTRSTTETMLAVRSQDATQLAQTIQEAGSAYVSALAALGGLRNADAAAGGDVRAAASDAQMAQGREVAMGALYGAAFELARLSPGDADVLLILQILEQRRGKEQGRGEVARNVVWF